MRLRVADATQINLAGRIYRAGEELEVGDADRSARVWLARGWAAQRDVPALAEPEPAPEGGDKPATDDQLSEPDVAATEPISDEELEQASKAELGAEAARLGVSKQGNKAQLAERIRAARA